mgnify:CR=1 FL=1
MKKETKPSSLQDVLRIVESEGGFISHGSLVEKYVFNSLNEGTYVVDMKSTNNLVKDEFIVVQERTKFPQKIKIKFGKYNSNKKYFKETSNCFRYTESRLEDEIIGRLH